MGLPSTGDAALDFTLEAGPRAITPDTPEHILLEVGKYKSFTSLREALKGMKLERRARIIRDIQRTCRENRILEKLYKATPSQLPHARIPVSLKTELEAENKQAWNPEMREDTLRCYPGLLLNVKHGIDGLGYVGG